MSKSVDLSIVVPMYNEKDSVAALYSRLVTTLEKTKKSFEIVFVDDLSTDPTRKLLADIAAKDERVVLVELLSNFGQTGAIAAGIDIAVGDVIIPMDGDLQHAPEDIPAFLEGIDAGFDVVSGWREKRVDGLILRRIPSKVANLLLAKLSGLDLHDFGTTFKAYRKPFIKSVNLYGDFHRFIPFLIKEKFRKVKIKEIPIQNIERPFGESNYGISRTFTVFFDLIRVKFIASYRMRPLQVFGSIGLLAMAAGLGGFFVMGIARLLFDWTVTTQFGVPAFTLCGFLILSGLQFLFSGLLAELIVKNHNDFDHVKPYVVGRVLNGKESLSQFTGH